MFYDLVYRNSYIFKPKVLLIVLVFDLMTCLDLYHNYESSLSPYVP